MDARLAGSSALLAAEGCEQRRRGARLACQNRHRHDGRKERQHQEHLIGQVDPAARLQAQAERIKGDTGENLIGLLERRLDAVVYRAKFVATIWAARQFVNHGHIEVNGQRVNIASYRVKEGDVISVRDKARQLAIVLEAIGSPERDVPEYLAVDHGKLTAEFVRVPALSDVPYPVMMEPNLVVEYYAQN